MTVEIEAPEEYQGPVAGDVNSRRGIILTTDVREGVAYTKAEVPLVETFGYATDLRSLTKGQGTFTMELGKYGKVPAAIQEDIIATAREAELVGA